MAESVYVHIPFCRQKCNYCSFISFTNKEYIENYINALLPEISERYQCEKIKTLYFGGGTPSLLSPDYFEKILSKFIFCENPEITIEVNPEYLTLEYLKNVFETGINRVSIGVQSFNQKILEIIGRKHSVSDIFKAVEFAKSAGFKNISIDLIYGLPEQTLEDFEKSINKAISLDVNHISSYGLKIDEGSYFYKNKPKSLPDSDMQADMYLKMIDILGKNGFKHYEISNFAKNGFESKHNLNYWNAKEYYGFGCAACGYENKIRYSHENLLENYIKNPVFLIKEPSLTEQEMLEEYIFLGLRKKEGINLSDIKNHFNIDFNSKYGNILNKYSKYFEKNDDFLNFTDEGFLISNIILSEFIEA